ncbi:MAG: HEAT repeat domain-containing protein [Planctomycetota bacterium]
MPRRLATSVGLASTLALTFVTADSLEPGQTANEATPRAREASEAPELRASGWVTDQSAAIALALAKPADWPEHIQRVRESGDSAVTELIDALHRLPGTDGSQAIVATLGALGGEEARRELRSRLSDPDVRIATEAGLALAHCGEESDRPLLVDTALDPSRPVRARTAALVGAILIRPTAELADLAEGIWLAGTDRRIDLRERYQLPDQSRWAFERTMLIELARSLEPETDWDLDPDASWSQLEAQFKPFRMLLERR